MSAPAAVTARDDSLSFDETVLARRSVRAFRPDPVPQPLLEHVFALAARAPSNCNTQPWFTAVASGAACERLRQMAEEEPAAAADVRVLADFVRSSTRGIVR